MPEDKRNPSTPAKQPQHSQDDAKNRDRESAANVEGRRAGMTSAQGQPKEPKGAEAHPVAAKDGPRDGGQEQGSVTKEAKALATDEGGNDGEKNPSGTKVQDSGELARGIGPDDPMSLQNRLASGEPKNSTDDPQPEQQPEPQGEKPQGRGTRTRAANENQGSGEDSLDRVMSVGHRRRLREKRNQTPDLGDTKGPIDDIVRFIGECGGNSVLDYGSANGGFAKSMAVRSPTFRVDEFDPSVPGKDEMPGKADVVVVYDTLNHIEDDKLEPVVDHVAELARKGAVFVIPVDGEDNESWVDEMDVEDWLSVLRGRFPRYTLRDTGPGDRRQLVFEGRKD